MNKLLKSGILLITVTVLFAYGCQDGTQVTSPEPEPVEQLQTAIDGQYIVVLRPVKGKAELGDPTQVQVYSDEILSENNISTEKVTQRYGTVLAGFSAQLDENEVERLKVDPRVDYIEQDKIIKRAPPCGTPNGGPCDGGGGGGGGTAQETPYGITRVNGGVAYTGSNVAWILDSGIDLDHPDLNVDATRGFNAFTSGRDSKSLDDGDGHGTHVAGTVAAIDNEIGVIGVAAGATVIPVKVLDSRGSGTFSGVIAGIDHVGANGSPGDVANMSLGGGASQALNDAVIAASSSGIWFALAAGNESTDANTRSPASANGQYIVTISAMDANDNWASFSNFGNPPVDFAAPGVATLSTWKDGGYNTISGTSMATPHAAGVLLLGSAATDGTVNGDPDGTPDPIIVH